MLFSIGAPAATGGTLQLRIGPVPSTLQHLWNGPPVVTVKGSVTIPSLAGSITVPKVRGTITTPTVVGIAEA
jgi:hypothetical protein